MEDVGEINGIIGVETGAGDGGKGTSMNSRERPIYFAYFGSGISCLRVVGLDIRFLEWRENWCIRNGWRPKKVLSDWLCGQPGPGILWSFGTFEGLMDP